MENITPKRFVSLLCTACVLVLCYVAYLDRGADTRLNYLHEITIDADSDYDNVAKDHGLRTSMMHDEDHQSVNKTVHLNDRENITPTLQDYDSNNDLDREERSNWWNLFANSDHQVQDLQTSASPSKSRMALIDQKARYFVGDVVTVEIKVKDHQGNPKTRGGDYIRIWIKGPEGTGSMGKVVDNGDGSYIGRIKLLWTGDNTIKAKIVAQREQMIFMFQKIREGNMLRKFIGDFRNGSFNERLRCTGSQMLSRNLWTSSCNLTSMNRGLPWFCQRPGKLQCLSWKSFSVSFLSRSEIKKITLPWTADKVLITPEIHVLVEKRNSGEDEPSSNPSVIPCNKVSARRTWNARTPVGYAKNGTWFSMLCSSKFDGSNIAITDCLKGRRTWMIGDSTVRQFFTYLQKKLSLELKTTKWTSPKWYGLSLAEDHEQTFSILYAVHGLPFYHGPQWEAVKGLNATHLYIDTIPAGSNDIVMVHFYIHFQLENPEVLRMSVRKTVSSLKALKQRAPNTVIVVKGPHSFQFHRWSSLGDFWGNIVTDIYREEFKSLQDDVIYLDLWELTVATETTNRHPPDNIITMIMNYFLSLICPKLQ